MFKFVLYMKTHSFIRTAFCLLTNVFDPTGRRAQTEIFTISVLL